MLSLSISPEEDRSSESAAQSGAIGNLGRMIPRFISSIRQDRRMTYLRACVCVYLCVWARGECVFVCVCVSVCVCVCICVCCRGESVCICVQICVRVCEKESEFICVRVRLITCVCTCSYVRVCMFLMIKNVFF